VNFGILPLEFSDPSEYDRIGIEDRLVLRNLHEGVREGHISIENRGRNRTFGARHNLSARQANILLAGGLINWVKRKL
jgi:aconitate hydratase